MSNEMAMDDQFYGCGCCHRPSDFDHYYVPPVQSRETADEDVFYQGGYVLREGEPLPLNPRQATI